MIKNLYCGIILTLSVNLLSACADKTDVEAKDQNPNLSQAETQDVAKLNTPTIHDNYETALIAGVNFTIKGTPSGCTLIAENNRSLDLDLKENCKFHRIENGDIQIMKGHHGPTFLIMSVTNDEENSGCEHRISTVTVVNKKTYIDPVIASGAACWGQYPLDDIYFLAPRFEGLPYPGD